MTELFQDPNLTTPDQSGLALAPGQNVPGVGMQADSPAGVGVSAPPDNSLQIAVDNAFKEGVPAQAPRRQSVDDEVRAKLQGMSGFQKVGALLGEFGAGVTGKTSPLRQGVEDERKNRLMQMAELKENVSALEHGVGVSQKLQGDARDGFVNDYADQLESASPGLGKTFKNLAAQPGLLQDYQKYMPYLPEPMKILAQNNPAEFLKVAGTEHGIKSLDEARKQYLLKSGTDKARLTMASVKAHPEALIAAGVPQELIDSFVKDPKASTFAAINDALPASSPSKMSADEILSGNDSKHFYPALGMKSLDEESDIRKKQGEATDTAFMKEAAARYGKDTPEYKDAIERHVARMDAPARTSIHMPKEMGPQAEALYHDYSNHPQVKEANELEVKFKPILDYMKDFTKTGKSVNAQDAAIAKAYLAATTSLGNRAYTMDKKELEKLPDLGDRLGNMASSFFTGKDLTDQTRHDMVKVIGDRYRALDAARQEQKQGTIKRGKGRGITQEQIFGAD